MISKMLNSGEFAFWRHAFAIKGSVSPKIIFRVMVFGCFGFFIKLLYQRYPNIAISIGPVEVSGAAVSVIIVLRIDAGYDRWWEARKLWGGIVNQSRNLVISALAYGPVDEFWRKRVATLAASFAYVAKGALRGSHKIPELRGLLDDAEIDSIESSHHGPIQVSYLLGRELQKARQTGALDGFSFLQIDKERTLLMDYLGASERILKTPIPYVCLIKVRRFIFLYLLILPFALVSKVGWLTPFVELFVAFPFLALDQIGEELQNPFSKENLSHLPLDEISQVIKSNLIEFASFNKVTLSEVGSYGSSEDRARLKA